MSKYYANYPQYLGARKCCDLRTQGPVGPEGATGPAGVGERGWTGPTGQSFTGPTGRGCRGPTGEPGPAGGPTGPTGPGIQFDGSGNNPGTGGVFYDTSTNSLKYSVSKSFIIDHPIHNDRHLVHTCLEGPEAGVYYRGTGEILDNHSATIKLPYYVDKLAMDLTVQLTPIYNGKINVLNSSEVSNNQFIVYGENCKFYWNVYGKRFDINIEPLKTDVVVKGNGPYLYI